MNKGDNISPQAKIMLSRYQLLKRIGMGGMGEVWLAEDPSLHRQVAVKTLPLTSQNDNEFLRRFELEARAAAALNHPHILPIHDFGTQAFPNNQAITYIVLPYISGGSLDERINFYARTNTRFPHNEALEYLSQAAEAIDYAHSQGIIHRDIKPGNMLLRNKEWLLLADFGIARMLASEEKLTQTGVGFGTPEYMAPEQAQGKAEAASDNYSLAVIAYRLLSGRLPFSAESSYATTMQHILNPPPPPSQFNPAISPDLEQAILHGLEKDPLNRPASARAFVAELKANALADLATMDSNKPVAEETTIQDLNTDPPASKQVKSQKLLSRREVLIGGGALVVLGAGSAIWAETHQNTGLIAGKSTPTATRQPTSISQAANQNPGGADFMLQGHNSPINTLAWSGGQKLYSSAQDKLIKQWDLTAIQQQGMKKTTSSTRTLDIQDSDARLACSPDGQYIAIGNLNPQALTSFDTRVTKIYKSDLSGLASGFEATITLKKVQAINAINWRPGKYLIISYSLSTTNISTDATLNTLLSPTAGGKTLSPFTINASTGGINPDQKHQIMISPDGTQLAFASNTGVLVGNFSVNGNTTHWHQTKKLVLGANVLNSTLCVAWSPDGQYIAGISEIGDNGYATGLWLWNIQTTKGFSFKLPNQQITLTDISWSPAKGSHQLAACDKDGKVYLWNANPNAANSLPARTIDALPNTISDLAWSPDGTFLAVAYQDNNNSILIWRM
jgi:serine/threonine protein kinase